MLTFDNIFFIFLAYLTGAFPSAVWVGRSFFDTDVREYGSGNAGATNTFRVLGVKAGLPVLILDVLKGWLAVKYAHFIQLGYVSDEYFFELQLTLGIAAVVGHLFPVYTGFRGGKGIATMLGLLIGLHPLAAIICFVIFLIVFFISRYVSLGSLVAALFFPIVVILVFESVNSSLNLFSIFVPILSLITHQKNIERLLRHEESKVNFEKKRYE